MRNQTQILARPGRNMAGDGPRGDTPGAPCAERLSASDFDAIATMLRESAGIKLGSNKRELVFGRLIRRLRVLGLQDFTQYLAVLEGPDGDAERVEMVNALTTNLTSFFREPHHFTFLAEQAIPALLKSATEQKLRIWSAACSSGEEPYSIALVLCKALASKGQWNARSRATDIDTTLIKTAQRGHSDAERAAGIPDAFNRLCMPQANGTVAMPEAVKERIAFRPLNLLGAWPMRGKFDIVFCRNVVIYFDKPTQRTLFSRIADVMNPGGWLFIGHSESLLNVSDRFQNVGRTIYRKL